MVAVVVASTGVSVRLDRDSDPAVPEFGTSSSSSFENEEEDDDDDDGIQRE